MEKCYIAGKISDLPLREYIHNFTEAKKEVEDLGFIPISPTDLPHSHDKTWLSYMREDLKALLSCDAIYMLSNWESSTGAKIEFNLAYELGIKVIYQKK